MQHMGQELKRASRLVGGRLTRRVSMTAALLALAACGGGEAAAPKVVATVDVAPLTVNIAPGQSTPLTATAREASGAAISGRAVSWTSSAPSIVTVSAGGVLTGVSEGTATVTASVDGRTGSASVVVRTPIAAIVLYAQHDAADARQDADAVCRSGA